MERYSESVGDWSEKYQQYRWQPLPHFSPATEAHTIVFWLIVHEAGLFINEDGPEAPLQAIRQPADELGTNSLYSQEAGEDQESPTIFFGTLKSACDLLIRDIMQFKFTWLRPSQNSV